MAEPQRGYRPGVDRLVVGNIVDGKFTPSTEPDEGFNPGVLRINPINPEDAAGDETASGVRRAVTGSVTSGQYSVTEAPEEGFNSGIYRATEDTATPEEGFIEGIYDVVLGSVSGGKWVTYTPDAWLLNGTSQYQSLSSSLPRNQVDEAFLFIAGFRVAEGSIGTDRYLWGQNDFHFQVILNSSNVLQVTGHDGTTPVINVTTTSIIPPDNAVHALAIHGDLSTASPVLTIVLDGNVMETTENDLDGLTGVDFQAGVHYCGAKHGSPPNSFWNGCLWNIGLDHGDSADIPNLTTAANRDAIMSGNRMKDPGADASNYFGRQPVVFFQEEAANSGVNSGTGGAADDFTVTDGPFSDSCDGVNNKYIDASLTGGTTTSYNPTAAAGSRESGGSDTGYETFADYWAARAVGDTVIFRSGDYTNTAQRTVDQTGMTFRNYQNETATLTTTSNVIGFLLSNPTFFNGAYEGGSLSVITNATTAGNAAIKPNSTASIINGLGIFSTAGSHCVRFNQPTVTGTIFDRCHIALTSTATQGIAIGGDSGTNGAAGTATFNTCIIDGGSIMSKTMNWTFNDCLHHGGGPVNNSATASINAFGPSGVVTVNNPIALGTGISGNATQVNWKQGSTTTFNVNGGEMVGNFQDPDAFDSGTVTYNSLGADTTVRNELIQPTGYGAGQGIVTLAHKDSTFSVNVTDTYVSAYTTMLASKSAGMSWYPDDSHLISGYSQARIDRVNAWINGGNELGNAGYSSDTKGETSPLSVTYGGAGTGTIVISGSGTQLQLQVDGTPVVGGTFDTSRSFSGDGVFGATTATGNLAQSINDITNWTATLSSSGFDDTLTYTMEDGTYSSGDDLLFNEDRRWQEEVEASIADWETIAPAGTIKTMQSFIGEAQSSYKDYVENSGAVSGFFAREQASPINEIITSSSDPFNHMIHAIGSTMIGTRSQADIEAAARVIATNVLCSGSYVGLSFPIASTGAAWTADEAEYLLDELISSGVQVMTFYEAIQWIAANGDTVTAANPKTGFLS